MIKIRLQKISKLLQWYRGDFGGNSGIRTIVKKYLEKDITGYVISYAPYNYSEDLDNFS